MSSAQNKKPGRPQEDELSALIEIRQSPKLKDDTTGKLDRVALERAEKTARSAQRLEHRTQKRPPIGMILAVLAVATALGWFAAQRGWI